MAAEQKNAYYRIYNQTTQEWDYYFFKTTAEQVITNGNYAFIKPNGGTTINGQNFTVNANGGNATASVTINASHINWYGGTKPTTNYLGSAANIQAALVQLDTKVKDAYDNIPPGILTTINYANTLGNVYQAKDADLTAIAGLTGSGFLKRNSNNSWELKTIYSSDVLHSKNGDTPTIGTLIDNLDSSVAGLQQAVYGTSKSIAISNEDTSSVTAAVNKNSLFVSTADDLQITFNSFADLEKACIRETKSDDVDFVIFFSKIPDNWNNGHASVLNIGDSVFVTQTNVPDRWFGGITESGSTYTAHFYKLETYNMTWAAISDKPNSFTPSSHTHGNIQNNGTITSTAVTSATGVLVYDSNNKIQRATAADARTIIGAASATDAVPYTNATKTVNLNSQSLENVGSLYLGNPTGANATFSYMNNDESGLFIGTNVGTGNVYIEAAPYGGGIILDSKDDNYWITNNSGDNPVIEKIASQEWTNQNFSRVFIKTGSTTPTAPTGGFHAGDIWIN